MTTRRLYKMMLAAVPDDDSAVCSVLELDRWQQQRLDELVAGMLNEKQWQAVNAAVLANMSAALVGRPGVHLTDA